MADGMEATCRHNLERFHYQGIGRFEPAQVYDKCISPATSAPTIGAVRARSSW
jgi:hypothetical protein